MTQNKYGGINDMPEGWTAKKENNRIYGLWFQMLRRCYDTEQHKRSRGKSYLNCEVSERWMRLSNFAKDIAELPGYEDWKSKTGYCLDKDIMVPGNKTYSMETCSFVSAKENISDISRRNPYIMENLHKRNRTKYALEADGVTLLFDSERDACNFLGVHQCSVSSCRRRNRHCKGYRVYIAKMDANE